MKSIFLCFANDEKESLKSLKQERSELLKLLDQGHSKNHFILREIPNATIENMVDGLINYQKNLNVFLFSGHAGRDKLAFKDGIANANGVIGLLGQCPKLDLVILNGCSTEGQVKALSKLPSKPAVIATSAPVEDHSATRFSISFFKTLIEQGASLKDAFDTAFSVTQMGKNFSRDRDDHVRFFRELVSKNEEEGVWGLFIHKEGKGLNKWKLPCKSLKQKKSKENNILNIRNNGPINNQEIINKINKKKN